MNLRDVIQYWFDFRTQGEKEGWNEDAYNEYQFAQFLKEHADAT